MPTLADVPSAPVSTLRPAGAWRLLVRELSAFGVVGALCFVLDVGLFQLLYATVGLGAVTAKALSTLVSIRRRTWGTGSGPSRTVSRAVRAGSTRCSWPSTA